MRYSEEDIVWLDDPVESIRSHPDMYLRGGFNASSMAGRLAGDALMLGALHVTITRSDMWHIISADNDWLSAHPPVEPRETFFQIVRFPEAGVNSMRGEILLTAFASKVISASSHNRFVVKGSVEMNDAIWSKMCLSGTARSIAFQGEDD